MIKISVSDEQARELTSFIKGYDLDGDWWNICEAIDLLLDSEDVTGLMVPGLGVELLKR